MKKLLIIFVLLVHVTLANANPIVESPTTTAATIVCVIAGLLLEIFLTTGVLLFSGIALAPTFFVLIFGNIASYCLVLGPLAYIFNLHVIFVEIAVISVEATFIKLICHFSFFQQESFIDLKWRFAFLAAILGNASSYYVGTLIA